MRRLLSAILFGALFAPPQALLAAINTNNTCGAPEEFLSADEPLAQFGQAVSAGGVVNVLAVGSATTVGSVTAEGLQSAAEGGSFPWHMIRALHAALPSVKFDLTVRGGRGMTAEDMLPLIDRALEKRHYPLVLWQTGTVEAVHGVRPDVLRGALEDGADAADNADADLVLIDPQYSRFLRANTDLSPYETVLAQMASNPGVTLFHRFDLTQTWVNNGQVDLERVSPDERDKTIALLNDCLGQALARYVLATVSEH